VTYRIGADGRPGTRIITPSSGIGPFGFGFSRGRLIVSEAAAGVSGDSSTSSYAVSDDGLEVISGSIRDFGTAACWLIVYRGWKICVRREYRQWRDFELPRPGQRHALAARCDGEQHERHQPSDRHGAQQRQPISVRALGGRPRSGRLQDPGDGKLTRLQTIGGLPRGAQGIAGR
jgi:hypothetical protein